MNDRSPIARRMRLDECRDRLDVVVRRVSQSEERVLVEQDGEPVIAVVSTADLARLGRLDRERQARFAAIDDLRAAFADVPPEEIEREADRAVAELRAELRLMTSQTRRPLHPPRRRSGPGTPWVAGRG